MYFLEIIDASTLDVEAKTRIRQLFQDILAAMSENEEATAEFHRARASMNERQYARRLSESKPSEKRDELIKHQIAWRNVFANSVYRSQGALRRMQELGKKLHAEVGNIDTSELSAKTVATAAQTLIERCIAAGADKPNAVVKELTRVADISQENIEDAVRELFEQKRSGRGKFAHENFSSQPIMVTDQDSAEQIALWHASQNAEKLFYRVRRAFGEYDGAKSRLNVPQFVKRLENAQAANDTELFEKISREQKIAESNLFVAAGHFLSLICGYKAQINEFSAIIAAAAATVTEVRGNKNLVIASNCLGANHWLVEMERQLNIAWTYHDPRPVLSQLGHELDASRASEYPQAPESTGIRRGTPCC